MDSYRKSLFILLKRLQFIWKHLKRLRGELYQVHIFISFLSNERPPQIKEIKKTIIIDYKDWINVILMPMTEIKKVNIAQNKRKLNNNNNNKKHITRLTFK